MIPRYISIQIIIFNYLLENIVVYRDDFWIRLTNL